MAVGLRLGLGERGELDVVHDDEAVEEGDEGRDAGAAGLEEEGVGESESRRVTLDAALCAEDEVVAAVAGAERLDRVGDHAVEPAGAIASGDTKPAEIFKGGEGGAGEQRVETGVWALLVSDSYVEDLLAWAHRKVGGKRVCGNICVD